MQLLSFVSSEVMDSLCYIALSKVKKSLYGSCPTPKNFTCNKLQIWSALVSSAFLNWDYEAWNSLFWESVEFSRIFSFSWESLVCMSAKGSYLFLVFPCMFSSLSVARKGQIFEWRLGECLLQRLKGALNFQRGWVFFKIGGFPSWRRVGRGLNWRVKMMGLWSERV